MKTKRIVLITDLSIQLLLVIMAVYFQYGKHVDFDPMGINKSAFICFYFVFGGWQVLSFFVHLIAFNDSTYTLRKIYGILLLIHILFPFGGFAGLYLILCTSPWMGLYYFIICFIDLMNT